MSRLTRAIHRHHTEPGQVCSPRTPFHTIYDSFGNATANLSTRYQFTGREFDNLTGLHYYRARWYDASVGRFISEDPIGFAGGDVNLYGYVWNSPVKLVDPKGTDGGATIVLGGGAALLGAAKAVVAAIVAAAPPVAVVVVGAAAIYGAAEAGTYVASHPSNPFVNGPLNPFGNPNPTAVPYIPPYGTPQPRVAPLPPFPMDPPVFPLPMSPPGPVCDARPRAIPRSIPWEDPPDDRDGCAEEISRCVQLCAIAEFDNDMKNIWGGSLESCLRGCVSVRCQKGLRF